MDNIQYFLNKILEISKKTRTTSPVVRKDNRLGKNYVAEVFSGIHTKTGRKTYFMRYNEKVIKNMSKPDMIHAVCHELGHIKTSGKNRKEREYRAERFALKIIKKYYPRHYSRAIAYVKKAQYFMDNVYSNAFKKILKKI